MPAERKKRKQYEPPVVKEIGGAFGQAMGLSYCTAGDQFGAACPGGTGDQAGCPGGLGDQTGDCGGGPLNQGCLAGPGDNVCSGGWGVT